RTRELMSPLMKVRDSCDAIWEKGGEKDEAYRLRPCRDKLTCFMVSIANLFLRRRNRVAVVPKAIPYVAIELIHSDEMGLLVARLAKTTLFHGSCLALEEVATLKEPFELEKMPGYYPLSKKEFDQAGFEDPEFPNRVYKVGLSDRVESSDDNEDLGEDASKQRRKIHDIDVDEDITRVNDQDDEQMFDVNDLQEVEDINTAKLIVDVAHVNVADEVNVASIATTNSVAATMTVDEVTLAQALMEIKSTKPKAKWIVLQEPKEPVKLKKKDQIMLDEEVALKLQAELKAEFDKEQRLAKEQKELNDPEKATLFMQLLEKIRKFFAAKRAEEKRNKPPTQSQQRKIMCTYLKNMEGMKLNHLKNKSFDNIQELFDKVMKRVNTFIEYRTELVEESFKKAEAEVIEGSSKRAGTELEQESSKKKKIDDDKETAKLKQLVKIIPNEEGVAIDAIPLVVKPPSIVDWKIHKEGKKSYYQIIRVDGSSKIYLVFSHMLKSFNREDVKTL
nr:hypothetical protein [Tanacetum cinerariifolium]